MSAIENLPRGLVAPRKDQREPDLRHKVDQSAVNMESRTTCRHSPLCLKAEKSKRNPQRAKQANNEHSKPKGNIVNPSGVYLDPRLVKVSLKLGTHCYFGDNSLM